jgi:predicted small lipoprotein YifL
MPKRLILSLVVAGVVSTGLAAHGLAGPLYLFGAYPPSAPSNPVFDVFTDLCPPSPIPEY